MQPVITPAALVAAQKMMMNGAMNVMQTLASPLGIPMNVREMEDPMGGYCFALEIQGVELAHFQECSGLKNSTEVFEIREGGVNHAVHKLPGASRWENLVLRYGVSSDTSMMSLREQILNDDYSTASMSSFSSSVGGFTANLGAAVGGLLGGGPGQAQPKRFNGSIVIKNNRMQEMVRYTFKDAWAVSWEGPKFDSTNSSLAIESIEIAHHGIEVSRSWRAGIPMGWT
jgi:phage tail-like protein